MLKWDLAVLGVFVAVDEVRDGILNFLASLDVFSLAFLLALVWFLSKKKFTSKFGLGKFRLFGSFS